VVIPQVANCLHGCEADRLRPIQQELSLSPPPPSVRIYTHGCKVTASTPVPHFMCHKFVNLHPLGFHGGSPYQPSPPLEEKLVLASHSPGGQWPGTPNTTANRTLPEQSRGCLQSRYLLSYTDKRSSPPTFALSQHLPGNTTPRCRNGGLFNDTVQWLRLVGDSLVNGELEWMRMETVCLRLRNWVESGKP
jgi:hypothetical protein